jgi:DNA-binding NarL/FixJ family response regulator
MTRYRVLLADDHAPMLERIVALVASEFDVVGAVGDGQAALDAAIVLQPDVVVFDISMPVMSGLGAAARLAESAHPPRIVFLTVHDDPAFMEAARGVGAQAYVLKRHIGTDLLPAIRLALQGHTQFPSTAGQSHEFPARS